MKIVLMSMPDVAAVIMHESAFHMPNNGIASIGANVDEGHEVTIIDLIRKRRRVRQYVTRTLLKIRPDVVGLSAMAWQYKTCTQLARLIKQLLPGVRIVIGGYHATLMYEEIAASAEAVFYRFHHPGRRRGGLSATHQCTGRQRPARGYSVSVLQERRWIHSQPPGRTSRSVQAQAAHSRQAAADLGIPYHDRAM